MNNTDPLDQILSNLGDLEAALQRSREADRLAAEVTRLVDELQSETNRRGSLSRTLEGVCVALDIPTNTALMEIVRAATEVKELADSETRRANGFAGHLKAAEDCNATLVKQLQDAVDRLRAGNSEEPAKELQKLRETCNNQADIIDRAYKAQQADELAKERDHWKSECFRLGEIHTSAYDALGSRNRTDLAGQITRLRQDLETAQKGNRDSFAELERLTRERGYWEDTAMQNLRNSQYYRERLLEAAKHLGDDVFVCDDGSRSGDPLVDKVPELVAKLAHENETLTRQVPPPPPAPEESSVFDGPKGVEMDGLVAGELQFTDVSAITFREMVGQQWCSTIDRGFRVTDDISIQVAPGMWVVLCNVYRDSATGTLTYKPVKVSDLPKIP